MFKYIIGSKEFKSKFGSDVSLFSINPPCLKILSDDHYFAYNGFNPDYKEANLFEALKDNESFKSEMMDILKGE